MLVFGDVRRSYGEVRRRTRRARRASSPRTGSARAASGASSRAGSAASRRSRSSCTTAASTSSRCSACYRARAVPFNVNHHYTPGELRALLDMVGAEAIVYERRLGPLLADVARRAGARSWSTSTTAPASLRSRAAPPTRAPSTGPRRRRRRRRRPTISTWCAPAARPDRPKAVLWRQADIFVAAMGGSETTTAESLAAAAASGARTWFPAPPLMHAAAQWTAFAALHLGATIALHDDSTRFDARTHPRRRGARAGRADLDRRRRVRPAADRGAAPRARATCRALQRIGTGGAITSDECKQALLELLPGRHDRRRLRRLGDRRHGLRRAHPRPRRRRASRPPPARWCSRPTAAACSSPATTRSAGPRGAAGCRSATSATAKRTEATFPIVDGRRFAVPGDRATLERRRHASACSGATRWS